VPVDQLLQSVGTTWANVPPTQRRWGLVITALIVAGLAAVMMMGRPHENGADWSVLYSHLTPEAASQVVTALESHHVPFHPSDDGTSILVPADRLAATRIELAGEGLPIGIVGFGIFDHLPLGASDAVERVDYMRALEGQLTEAVEALGEIRSARVMLALPQTSTYTSEDKPARAAVMVQLQPGAELTASEVKAITHLVASSVEGLTPPNVSVVDDHGQLLAAGTGQADGTVSGSDLDALQRSTEQRIHDQISSLIDAVAGPGRSVIEVHADMRGAQIHTVEEQPSKGVPISQQSVQETYSGGPAPLPPTPPTPAPAAEPGKAPVYGPSAPAGTGMATQYQRQQQTTNFQEGRRRVETSDPGGQINRLAITVFVDNTVGLTTANNIQRSISQGFLDPKRGDSLVLTRVPFWQHTAVLPGGPQAGVPAHTPAKDAATGPLAHISPIMMAVGGAVGGAVLATLVLTVLRRGKKPVVVPAAPVMAPPITQVPVSAATLAEMDDLSKQVTEWTRRNPAVSADVVRAWWGQNGETEQRG